MINNRFRVGHLADLEKLVGLITNDRITDRFRMVVHVTDVEKVVRARQEVRPQDRQPPPRVIVVGDGLFLCRKNSQVNCDLIPRKLQIQYSPNIFV